MHLFIPREIHNGKVEILIAYEFIVTTTRLLHLLLISPTPVLAYKFNLNKAYVNGVTHASPNISSTY
jgi:hypothetical protein